MGVKGLPREDLSPFTDEGFLQGSSGVCSPAPPSLIDLGCLPNSMGVSTLTCDVSLSPRCVYSDLRFRFNSPGVSKLTWVVVLIPQGCFF